MFKYYFGADRNKNIEGLNKSYTAGIVNFSPIIPYKSIGYVKRRYFDYLTYDYMLFALKDLK